jgi:hypothetical protein
LAVGIFILLVVVRIPAILTDGRFWAEEGVVYYHAAWHQSWLEALFTIHTGYLNLIASVATLLALHLVTLEQAPLVTGAVACGIQILPAIILATSRIPWLKSWPTFTIAFLLLLIPAGDSEVWLNSITSQFHLALCVGLILASEECSRSVSIFRGVVLVAAPLAGPVSGALTPLFLLRAAVERSRVHLIQTVLLAVPTSVQAVIVLTHPEPARAIGIGLPLLLAVIGIQNVMLPIAGASRTAPVAAAAYLQSGIPVYAILIGAFGIGALGVALYRWGDRAALWLFAGGSALAVISYSTALTLGQPRYLLIWLGGRYCFAPTVLFSLSLLGLAATGRRMIPTILVIWMIYIGAGPYFHVPDGHARGVNWKDEVAAWRRDPAYRLRMWPLGWSPGLTLNPSARPDQ